jgi:hypothetical protein
MLENITTHFHDVCLVQFLLSKAGVTESCQSKSLSLTKYNSPRTYPVLD